MNKARKMARGHVAPRPLSVPMAEFIKDPIATYAKVKAGQELILTGRDAAPRMVIHPGTLADYATRD